MNRRHIPYLFLALALLLAPMAAYAAPPPPTWLQLAPARPVLSHPLQPRV